MRNSALSILLAMLASGAVAAETPQVHVAKWKGDAKGGMEHIDFHGVGADWLSAPTDYLEAVCDVVSGPVSVAF